MERLTADVRRELRRFGAQAGMPELVAGWAAALGKEIARNAWPARIGRDGTLHVATSSSAWAFELANLQSMVLNRLRSAFGDDAPVKVVFSPGRIPEPAAEPEDLAPAAPAEATPEELARARELASSVSDVELRSHIARAAAAALARAR